jgi:hypothetical protein
LPEFVSMVPASWLGPIALANATGNMILRLYRTSTPLTEVAARKGMRDRLARGDERIAIPTVNQKPID